MLNTIYIEETISMLKQQSKKSHMSGRKEYGFHTDESFISIIDADRSGERDHTGG